MLRLKHLLHPLRTARIATNRLRAHINMRRFASDSARRFEDDPRYDLQNVTDGFVSRFDKTDDDIGILIRICVAYGKALADQQSASASFNATEWWEQVRQSCLKSVIRALQERDVAALGLIYRNFFRDPCATGLVAVPFGMSNSARWLAGKTRLKAM